MLFRDGSWSRTRNLEIPGSLVSLTSRNDETNAIALLRFSL
jgi:hypothetical protein